MGLLGEPLPHLYFYGGTLAGKNQRILSVFEAVWWPLQGDGLDIELRQIEETADPAPALRGVYTPHHGLGIEAWAECLPAAPPGAVPQTRTDVTRRPGHLELLRRT